MHPFDFLTLQNGAKFAFTPCPGTKSVSLDDSLKALHQAGVEAVITLLPDSEMASLEVSDLGRNTESLGMRCFHFPVEDDCAPGDDFLMAFESGKSLLSAMIEAQATIAIHCRGGSGRTGLMAAILLLESGETWAAVKAMIQQVRPKALTLPVHVDYLKQHYSI